MICKKDHRYDELFLSLPDSQSTGDGRHKCAACAYEMGIDDGKKGNPRKNIGELNSLPDSQAGTVRHKSAKDTYDLGYDEAQNSK